MPRAKTTAYSSFLQSCRSEGGKKEQSATTELCEGFALGERGEQAIERKQTSNEKLCETPPVAVRDLTATAQFPTRATH